MYKLYYSPGACSMAVHVLLNEMGIPFEAKKVSIQDGENQTPEFLAINPRGQVPVLADEDFIIREGAAIIMYLLENHNSPLLPRSGRPRAAVLEWLMFANATLHPAYSKCFFIMRNVQDKAQQDALFKIAIDQLNKLWAEVDTKLAKSQYICGKEISPADIMVTVFANWGSYFPMQPTLGNNVKRLIREISTRPSYQKALKTEQVEYKAAAA